MTAQVEYLEMFTLSSTVTNARDWCNDKFLFTFDI